MSTSAHETGLYLVVDSSVASQTMQESLKTVETAKYLCSVLI